MESGKSPHKPPGSSGGGANVNAQGSTPSQSLFTPVSGISGMGGGSAYVIPRKNGTGSTELAPSTSAQTTPNPGSATLPAPKASTTPNTPSHSARPVPTNHPLVHQNDVPILPPTTVSSAGLDVMQVPPYHAPHPPPGVYHAYFSANSQIASGRSSTSHGKNQSVTPNPNLDSATALPSVLSVGAGGSYDSPHPVSGGANSAPENANAPSAGRFADSATQAGETLPSHPAPGSNSGIRWWRASSSSSGRGSMRLGGNDGPATLAATARAEGVGHDSTTSQPSSARLLATVQHNTTHRYHMTDYASESELPVSINRTTRIVPARGYGAGGEEKGKASSGAPHQPYPRSTSHTPEHHRLKHQPPHAASQPPYSDEHSPRSFTSPHTPVKNPGDITEKPGFRSVEVSGAFAQQHLPHPQPTAATTPLAPRTPLRVSDAHLISSTVEKNALNTLKKEEHPSGPDPAGQSDASLSGGHETDSPPPKPVVVGIDIMRVVAQKRRHSPAPPRCDEEAASTPLTDAETGKASVLHTAAELRPRSRVNTRVRNVRHGSATDRRGDYTLRRTSPAAQEGIGLEPAPPIPTPVASSNSNSHNTHGNSPQLVPLPLRSPALSGAVSAGSSTSTPAVVTTKTKKTAKPRPEPLLAPLDKDPQTTGPVPSALSHMLSDVVLPPAHHSHHHGATATATAATAGALLPPSLTAGAAPDLLVFNPIHVVGSSGKVPGGTASGGQTTPRNNPPQATVVHTTPSGAGLAESVRQMSTSFNSQRGNSRRTSRRGSESTLMAAIAAAEAVAQATPHHLHPSASRFSSSMGPGTTNDNTVSASAAPPGLVSVSLSQQSGLLSAPSTTAVSAEDGPAGADAGMLPPVSNPPASTAPEAPPTSLGGTTTPSSAKGLVAEPKANEKETKGNGDVDAAAQVVTLPSLNAGRAGSGTREEGNASPAREKNVAEEVVAKGSSHAADTLVSDGATNAEQKGTPSLAAAGTTGEKQKVDFPSASASPSPYGGTSLTAPQNNASNIALGTSSSALNFTALIHELDQRRQRIREQLNEMTKNVAGHSIFAIVRSTSTTQLHQILEAGLCNVNEQDHNGCTPLHIAASEGNQAIVRLLLSYGADILKKDFFGRTPLDCAAANRQSVGRYLMSVLRERREAERKQGDKVKGNEGKDTTDKQGTGKTNNSSGTGGAGQQDGAIRQEVPQQSTDMRRPPVAGGNDLFHGTPSPDRTGSPENRLVPAVSGASETSPSTPDVRQLPPTQNFHSLLLNVMSDSEHVAPPPAIDANLLQKPGSPSTDTMLGSGFFTKGPQNSSPTGMGVNAIPKSSPLFSPFSHLESQMAHTVNPSTSYNPMPPGANYTHRPSVLPGITEERYRAAAAAAAAAEATHRKTSGGNPGMLRLPVPTAPPTDFNSVDPMLSQRGYSIYEEGAVTTLLEHVVAQEEHRRKPVRVEKKEFSTFTAINDYIPLIVCMSGLPGRGKSFISKRVLRYLNWKGVPCEVFNAGNYRRQLLGVEGTADAAFFDPNNPVGKQLRERMAELACEDLVKFIAEHQPLSVGILDATNTTRSRRRWLETFFSDAAKKHSNPDGTPLAYRLLFIESVCTDENIITENILRSKCDNDDFKGTEDTNAVISEFRERIHQYEKVYEPLHADENFSFIKIINVKHHVVLHRVAGGLGSRIAFFLMNLHPVAFPVYLALPGETVGESKGEFGGDERLTERGTQYAFALRQFMEERFVPNMLVIHATSKSVVNTLLPATVPNPGIMGASVAASTTNTNVPDLPGFEELQQIQAGENRQRRGFSSPVDENSSQRLSCTNGSSLPGAQGHHPQHHGSTGGHPSGTANMNASVTGASASRALPRVTSGERILLERQLTNRAAMPVVVHRHVHQTREMPKPDSQSFTGTPTSGAPPSAVPTSFSTAPHSGGSPSSQRDLFVPGSPIRPAVAESTPTDKRGGSGSEFKKTPISSSGPPPLPTPTKVTVADVPSSTWVKGSRGDGTPTSPGLNVRITEAIVEDKQEKRRQRRRRRRDKRGNGNGKNHGSGHHHTIMSTILTEQDPQPSVTTPNFSKQQKSTPKKVVASNTTPKVQLKETPAAEESDKDSMGSSVSSTSSDSTSLERGEPPDRVRSAEIELGVYSALSSDYSESHSADSSGSSYTSASSAITSTASSMSVNHLLREEHPVQQSSTSAPVVPSSMIKPSVVTVKAPAMDGCLGKSPAPSHPPLHPLIQSPNENTNSSKSRSHSHHRRDKKNLHGSSTGSSPALSRQHSFTNNSVVRTSANGGLGGIGKGGLGAAGANRPLPRLASSSHLAATHNHPFPHPTSRREPPTQQAYEGNEDNMENGEDLDEVLCPVPGLDDLNYGKLNGRRPGWFQEQNPRAAQILFSKLGRTSSVANLLAGDVMELESDEDDTEEEEEEEEEEEDPVLKELVEAEQDGEEPPLAHSPREPVVPPLLPVLIKGNTTRKVLGALRHCWKRFEKHYTNAPHASSIATTFYPTLNYTALFPNGESVRQVISRLEPALMAVMRSQKPVFVVAPAIPTQGLLAFFLDVMPEKSPLLKLPKNGILEITVKGDVMVHPLPPPQLLSSLAAEESLLDMTV